MRLTVIQTQQPSLYRTIESRLKPNSSIKPDNTENGISYACRFCFLIKIIFIV